MILTKELFRASHSDRDMCKASRMFCHEVGVLGSNKGGLESL